MIDALRFQRIYCNNGAPVQVELSGLAVAAAAAGRTRGSARPTARITWTLAGARTRARTAAAGAATGRALTRAGAGDAALTCISARSALAHDSLLKMAAIWP